MSSQQSHYTSTKTTTIPHHHNPEAEPFQVIAMDFIFKLPLSRGYNLILTITDHDCTKASIFIPCKESMTTEDVTFLLFQWLYPNYGIPNKVIHDRDTKFISGCFMKLCQRLGIKQNVSSVYHPQTDCYIMVGTFTQRGLSCSLRH